MKSLFLGTSSGWPLPRLGCKCNICNSADAKDKRLRPSLLINDQILIDAPPDIYHQLKKYDVNTSKITHILLTHAHDDHIMGLYDLSHIYGGERIALVAASEVISAARKKLNISLLSFKIIEAKPHEPLRLSKDWSCTFIPVEHTVPAYAIKIKAPRLITYAPEFRRILPSSKKEISGSEVVIIDGSSKSSLGQAKGHETIEEGIRLGQEISVKKIFFTNIGHKTDRHEALEEFVKGKAGSKFNIAFDGLEVNV
jgi:phosphoribosyl 1,2-cyclic phosphate phosphodiesterase